jgi:DNA-binding NarL/FixJ family response regulator
VSIEPPEPDKSIERIAVALMIGDEGLRRRVSDAVNSDERFAQAAASQVADVLVADHVLEEREWQAGLSRPDSARADFFVAGLPALVVGEQPVIEQAMRRGYAGGLLPSFTRRKLLLAIEAALHGLICTDARADAAFDDEADSELASAALTIREAEVLQQLATGASNKEIARRLNISVHTVKFHVASIAAKLGAHGRTDVVARALRSARSLI